MDKAKPHVLIIGGGIIGICCAYFLAKRGHRVTVLERDAIGEGASYGNAGTIAPGHPPINKPGRVRQALRSLFDPLSPLFIAPRPDPALVGWLWDFTRHCSESHLEHSLQVLGPMGHTSLRLFDELISSEGLECHYEHKGSYEVYDTQSGLRAAAREAKLMRAHGYHPEVIDGETMRAREPTLKGGLAGGVYYPEGATLNPYRFVVELAQRARHYGAVLHSGAEVTELTMQKPQVPEVRLHDGQTLSGDFVVLAAGAYSAQLANRLGVYLPLQAAKGYHQDRVPREGETPTLTNACMLGETSVFCTPMDGFVRFAGTLEFSGLNHTIRRPRLEQLVRASQRYFTDMSEAKAQSEWCGLRPCLPDGLPAVGPLRKDLPRVLVATGHAMMGVTLGPVTGQLIAEHVANEAPNMDLQALRPDRFG